MSYTIGIDTGGTYTDCVLIDSLSKAVIKKAKALTTKHNLIEGIINSISNMGSFDSAQVDYVSLSTTLATNAIVEGKVNAVALITTGIKEIEDVPTDIIIPVGGKIDIRGNVVEEPELKDLLKKVDEVKDKVDGFAIVGYASVRNPKHEILIQKRIADHTKKPVESSHNLTHLLDYKARAVTTIYNVGLISTISNWIAAVKKALISKNIHAPVMIVKSDGSIMQDKDALTRPVETYLSGPAASITGGLFLSGATSCLIMDLGGTSLDTAVVKNGKVKMHEEGVCIDNRVTRIRAADINTFGLGGDSNIEIHSESEIKIGPGRVLPICRSLGNGAETGLTPTDLLHYDGTYKEWDRDVVRAFIKETASRLGIKEKKLVQTLKDKVCCEIYQKSEHHKPIVGVGAPFQSWAKEIKKRHHAEILVPQHSEVANAIGAATANIYEVKHALIRPIPEEGIHYVYSPQRIKKFKYLKSAKRFAIKELETIISEATIKAGSNEYEIISDVEDIFVEFQGKEVYYETRIKMHTVGKAKWVSD